MMVPDTLKNGTLVAAAAAVATILSAGSPLAQQYVSTAWMGHSTNLGTGQRVGTRPSGLTAHEAVKVLRDNGMPISAIAEMARVERKTIYSWLDGTATVRSQNEDRIRTLFAVMKDATGGSYKQLHRVWNQKGSDGRSVRDLVTAEVLDMVAIGSRIAELRPTIEYYSNLEAKRPTRKTVVKGNPVLDALPTATLSS